MYRSVLTDRISIINAKIGAEIDLPLHVAFDVAVDGETVGSSVEWLDEGHGLVCKDCHLDVNPDVLETVSVRLEAYFGDVYSVVRQLLDDAVENLKTAEDEIAR